MMTLLLRKIPRAKGTKPMSAPILKKISKGRRGVGPCQHPYLEKILRGEVDRSIKGSFITLEKLRSSLEE